MKIIFIAAVLLLTSAASKADAIDVSSFRYVGPFTVKSPVMIDSLDTGSKKFSTAAVMDRYLDLSLVTNGEETNVEQLPKQSDEIQLHLIGFDVSNVKFTKADITVKGMKYFQIYVDGTKTDGKNVTLTPAVHEVVVKYATDKDEPMPMWGVSVDVKPEAGLSIHQAGTPRSYQLSDVLHSQRFNKVDLSPDGKYLIVGYTTIQRDGRPSSKVLVKDVATGAVIDQRNSASWMPSSCKYYFVRTEDGNRKLVTVDPVSHVEEILAEHLPDGSLTISPTEDFIILSKTQDGPKEDKDVYQVVVPDDRQPGWRNKGTLDILDLKTGIASPLVFSNHGIYLLDISADGKKLLVNKITSRLEQRPTTLNTLLVIDRDTYHVDSILTDGFLGSAEFSPDGEKLLLSGSPEAFGGIGNVVPEGQVPSMIDNQLFIMDLPSKNITPLTMRFNPSVQSFEWSKADGMIYFNAEDKDCINLFRLNPDNGKISRIDIPEDLVLRYSLSSKANMLALYGQSASNSDRMYMVDTKKMKAMLLEDLSAKTLKGIRLGECKAWNYLNNRGDTICCRYYLPADFNPSKQYPMVVNYYGGCSPTSRNFESRYPQHAYASQGYVVLVVNPSGATGFGQEFSSRHVNTAGEGVAEDIIGATRQFCIEHPFVNTGKIGCVGASYGGFMTQYLQTKTDLFAAAISHAGISDHTSYWGEGFWGYSYSEVSMANSYPWSNRKLYVDQSPLYNADKINTPILFLHGTADNNVPVGESIQMFTALKLLGKDASLVLVDGQDHHIVDYNKRVKWQNTIFAYFAKYLKDDPTWWNAIYTQPNF